MAAIQNIFTCLWFNQNAEEAANFYVSIFENSRIVSISHYGNWAKHMPEGAVLTVDFEIAGTRFMALNGGPNFPFTEAASIVVECETQEEIDRLWAVLTADGGKPVQCGWLKDRFGLPWQICPTGIKDMIADDDPQRRDRVMAVVIKSVKLDIAEMRAAAKGA